jgi:hypothetical protein
MSQIGSPTGGPTRLDNGIALFACFIARRSHNAGASSSVVIITVDASTRMALTSKRIEDETHDYYF